MALKVGDSINGYKIKSVINPGNMATSYFVDSSSKQYFMKEYIDPRETHPLFTKFYDNQAILIDRLNKMGSITEKFIEHFVEEGVYYQVKEKLNGIDLQKYLTIREYSERKQISIVFCGILRNLHNNKIVHQDLKPAQVMLIDDEIGKKTKLGNRMILSDFDWSIPDGKVVQNVGTIYYMSPEHYNNKKPIEQSDIFTAGVMIYEFLTGRNPYDFDDYADDKILKDRVLNKKVFADPKKLNNEINDEVNKVILSCLDPNPSKRPALSEIQDVLIGKSKLESTASAGLSKIVIKSGAYSYSITSNKEIDRNLLKTFFKDITDGKGNPIYKYCEKDKPMLLFSKESDGSFVISSPNSTKNYFTLNDQKIDSKKIKIKKGDKLNLFSTGESKIIALFEIQ